MTSIQGTCIIQLKSCNKHSFFTLHDMINKNSLENNILKARTFKILSNRYTYSCVTITLFIFFKIQFCVDFVADLIHLNIYSMKCNSYNNFYKRFLLIILLVTN